MLRSVFLGACGAMAVLAVSPLHAETDFYKGKTVTIITSTGAGGSYDIVARALARQMPRYIPGEPNMIVQNMPGGGNVLATNHMYNIAAKDGTVIATLHNAMPLHQSIDGKGVRYDASKFNWLGSTGPDNSAIFVWHTAGVKTIQDVMKKEVTLGGTGAGSGIVIFPAVMNSVLGTKFKIVLGYKSSEELNLAIERGEVQSRSFGLAGLFNQYGEWVSGKKIVFLAQVGRKRDKRIPDIPLITELAKTDEQRQILQLISSPTMLGYPYTAPPGVPADRLAVLRNAFASAMRDKAFLAEAEKSGVAFDPLSAEEVTEIVNETINAPATVIAKTKAAIAQAQE